MKNQFSERVKQLRKEQHMTLRELANKAEVSFVSLNHYEKGKYLPKVRTIYKIANALNCDFEELLELVKNEKE